MTEIIQNNSNVNINYPIVCVDQSKAQQSLVELPRYDVVSFEDVICEVNPYYNQDFKLFSDITNGKLFALFVRDHSVYVPENSSWYYYTGKQWKEDVGDTRVSELATVFADCILSYFSNVVIPSLKPAEEHEEARKKALGIALSFQNSKKRETLIKEARIFNTISLSKFDSNPNLFNCSNGTLDLTDFSFHKHSPQDYCLKISNVIYDENAKSVRFEQFIDEIFEGDNEKSKYLQSKLGGALTGEIHSEEMYCLYGPTTRNGKGTLMNSVYKVFGDYGAIAQAETILQAKYASDGNAPTAAMAALHGKRFVSIAEPPKNVSFDVAKIKQMTGNDPITARFLHKNPFTFRPQFKIFMHTNYLPSVNDPTLFSSNRMNVITFNRHFNENEMDRSLKNYFEETPEVQSAILNWLIEGLKNVKSNNWHIEKPQSIIDATNDYEDRSNKEKQFALECLELSHGEKEYFKNVYQAYRAWCKDNGYGPLGRNKLKEALIALRFDVSEGAGNKMFLKNFELNQEYTDILKDQNNYCY